MKVYELNNSPQAMTLTGERTYGISGHPIATDFRGDSKIDDWEPIKLETLYKNTYIDFPHYIIGKPIVSEKVKQILEPYIESEVEILPLIHDEMDLYMLNVTNMLDCVDWKRSEVEWFKDKYFMGFIKLKFDLSKIPNDTYLFKIKETAKTTVYVTEAFKELVEQHQLKGLNFSLVEDSEFTEEMELEQQRRYESALLDIERNKGPEFTYEEAEARVDQNKAVASGKWKMQLDDKGRFWLGTLTLELEYNWVRPKYIPPILLGYQWHEVEKSEINLKSHEE
ncbi:imm11 family protein [Paenibacillus sp. sgz5001063]|uniref:imm11 family protein n=1 Tax=Paenibacillus sp. sgz5001063 TaxID=3242474 RepID=UPI0036D3854F